MKKVRSSVTLLFILTHAILFGKHQITGRLIDSETKKGINNARVIILGSKTETVTNVLGYFKITADSSQALLIICPNYYTSKVQVPSGERLQVELTKVFSQDEIADTIVISPDLMARFNKIINKYIADIQNDYLKYPYAWTDDKAEKENLKLNKVRTIRNSMYESEYDQNGELIFDRSFAYSLSIAKTRTATFKDEFKRKENGELVFRISVNNQKPTEIQSRMFIQKGDTLYSKWSSNNVLKGVGITYKNIFVDYSIDKKDFTISLYKKKFLKNGYFVTEFFQNERGINIGEPKHYIFDANNNLIECSSAFTKERYKYNTSGLKIEHSFYVNNNIIKTDLYIRNQNGLIEKCIESQKELPTEIQFEYEFFE